MAVITYWRNVLRKITTTEMDASFDAVVEMIADAGLSDEMPEGQVYIGDNTNTASLETLNTALVPESTDKNYVSDAELVVIANTSGTNTGDNATNTTSNSYADAKVADSITDGVATIAPSQNAVFDALATKQNNIGYTAENSANKTDTVAGNEASSIKYPSIKGMYDWATGLFATIANLALKLNLSGGTLTGDLVVSANLSLTGSVNSSLTGSNARIPSHTKSNITFTNASLTSIASANNGGVGDGHTLIINNATGNNITIVNNYASANAGEKIYTGCGTDIVIPTNCSFWLQWNTIINAWSCVQSGYISTNGGTLTGALNEAPSVTLSSAATVNIFGANSANIIITGTTTITSFDTVAEGIIRYVRFTGNVTLTNNANIILQNNSNLTVKSGEVCIFKSEGGGIARLIQYFQIMNGVVAYTDSPTFANGRWGVSPLTFGTSYENARFTANGTNNYTIVTPGVEDAVYFGNTLRGGYKYTTNLFSFYSNAGQSARLSYGGVNLTLGDVQVSSGFIGHYHDYHVWATKNYTTSTYATLDINGLILGNQALGGDKLTINASAKFQVNATDKGSLPAPIMTNAQMLVIPSPVKGLLVDQSDSVTNYPSGLYRYNGSAWTLVGSSDLSGVITSSGGVTSWVTPNGTGSVSLTDSPTFTTKITTPVAYGSTSASGDLTLGSTSNATKGRLLFGTSVYDEVNNKLGVGVGTGNFNAALDIVSLGNATTCLRFQDKTTRIPILNLEQGASGNCNFLFYNTSADSTVVLAAGTGQASIQGGAVIGSMRRAGASAAGSVLDVVGAGGVNCLNTTGVTLASESLTNGALTAGTSWTASGDASLTGDQAVFTYSSGALSYINQTTGAMAVALKSNTYYCFTMTITGATANANGYTQVTLTDGTNQSTFVAYNRSLVFYFKTKSSPTQFRLTATLQSGQAFTIDDISCKEITSGGLYTGGGSNGLNIMPDGRLYGTALHNNAGDVTGTTNQYIASGTYTPTLTNVTNVAASTPRLCQWTRVGNVVTVSGQLDIDLTTTLLASEVDISLPIAAAFTTAYQCGGNASSITSQACWAIQADATNDRAQLMATGIASITNDTYTFHFTYTIL